MSGGYWNYKNDYLLNEIFGYNVDANYDIDSEENKQNRRFVIHSNPLEDVEISALVYDVFCLLHSYDWAKSGDTDFDVYLKDVAEFKKRWFKKKREDQIREIIDICTDNLRQELQRTFIGAPATSE